MSQRIESGRQSSGDEARTRDMPKSIPPAQPDHPDRISIGALDMPGGAVDYFSGSMCDMHETVRSHQESSRSIGNQRDIGCRSLGQLHRSENWFAELINAPGGADPDVAFPILDYSKAEIARQSVAFREALHRRI